MQKIGILVFFTTLALQLASPSPAGACSVGRGGVATDKDLIAWSGAIVRARAETYVEPPCPRDRKCVDHLGKIRFRVIEVLKGPYPFDTFHAWGRLDDEEVLNEVGGCETTAYKPDTEFLLFLENGSGIWVVSQAPLAATNREVSGANDPRVVWVRAEVLRLRKAGSKVPRKAPQ